MPDHENSYQHPEELLAGADRPRQLPPAVRARLEEALSGEQRARPLSAEVRGRLESSLRPQRARRKWTVLVPSLAAAAAIVVAAAVVVPGLLHKSTAGTSSSSLSALRAQRRSTAPAAARTYAPSFSSPAGAVGSAGSKVARPAAPPGRSGPTASAVAPRPLAANAVVVPPAVAGVSPRSGPAAGGTWVVVTGQGLGGVTGVHFGNVLAARVTVVSAGEVRALSPAHAPGTVDVVVNGQIRKSGISPADRYSFVP